VVSGDRRAAIVAVEPRLLADAISRYLELRGVEVATTAPPGRLVDLVITHDSSTAPAARVVVTLPRQVGERGSVSFIGRPAFRAIDGVEDLDAVLRLFDA
jgi:hypothetical protein